MTENILREQCDMHQNGYINNRAHKKRTMKIKKNNRKSPKKKKPKQIKQINERTME